MPTYDYECSACKHAEEVFQRMSEEPLTKCTSCGKKKFKRIITTVNFCMNEPRTLGQLAEKNSKKMGKEKLAEKTREEAKRNEAVGRAMRGGKSKNNKSFYGKLDEKTRRKVLKTRESKQKYIYEGKVD